MLLPKLSDQEQDHPPKFLSLSPRRPNPVHPKSGLYIGVRPSALTGMGSEMKAVFGGARINRGEPLGRTRLLVATNTERNHAAIAKLDSQIEHALRLLGTELADGIEDPQQRNAEVFFSALATAIEALEKRGEILFAPEADAGRNNHLRMKNVMRLQPLHQPVSNQLVVFRSAQVSCHILKRSEEAFEVRVVVELFDFGQRSPIHPVTLAKFQQRSRLDRPFKMQMQFSLRQRVNKAGGLRRHRAILKQSGHPAIGRSDSGSADTLVRADSGIRARNRTKGSALHGNRWAG